MKEFLRKLKSFKKDNIAFGVVSELETLGLTFSEGEIEISTKTHLSQESFIWSI